MPLVKSLTLRVVKQLQLLQEYHQVSLEPSWVDLSQVPWCSWLKYVEVPHEGAKSIILTLLEQSCEHVMLAVNINVTNQH